MHLDAGVTQQKWVNHPTGHRPGGGGSRVETSGENRAASVRKGVGDWKGVLKVQENETYRV